MKKLATLFTDSYQELFKVRTITTAAMFAAISVILGIYTIVLGDGLKIGFSSIPNEIVYYLFGPVVGGLFGGMLDLLKYVAKPTGPFFPGFTFNAVLGGVLYGVLLYKKPLTVKRVFAAKFVVALICNVGFNTLWLSMLYGKSFTFFLPVRALKNLIMWPIDSMLFYTVTMALESAGAFKIIRAFNKKVM